MKSETISKIITRNFSVKNRNKKISNHKLLEH